MWASNGRPAQVITGREGCSRFILGSELDLNDVGRYLLTAEQGPGGSNHAGPPRERGYTHLSNIPAASFIIT